jgi:hypothetical protein
MQPHKQRVQNSLDYNKMPLLDNISYYFTLYFLRHVSALIEQSSGNYKSRDYTRYMSIIIIKECNSCIPPCTGYCGSRHRLANSTVNLYMYRYKY